MIYFSSLRHEELPEVGGFVKESLSRDLDSFNSFSGIYNADYLLGFQGSITNAMNVIGNYDKKKLLKNLTTRLYNRIKNSRNLIGKIEFFVKRANGQLDIQYIDFGFKALRANISSKNVEGITVHMQALLNNVVRNHDVLLGAGYKTALSDSLETLLTTIRSENQQQNILIGEKEAQTIERNKLLSNLWMYISEVCEAGKLIFRDSEPEKLKDYTYSELKKRVRHSA